MTTKDDVLTYIETLDDTQHVATVLEAAARQLNELNPHSKDKITPGRRVKIVGKVFPRCLSGLTGTVQASNRSGARFEILLDEASTEALRRHPGNRDTFEIADDVERFAVLGPGVHRTNLQLRG